MKSFEEFLNEAKTFKTTIDKLFAWYDNNKNWSSADSGNITSAMTVDGEHADDLDGVYKELIKNKNKTIQVTSSNSYGGKTVTFILNKKKYEFDSISDPFTDADD